jgi:hypothetical protein
MTSKSPKVRARTSILAVSRFDSTRTPVKHTHSTPVFHIASETHNMPHIIARISTRERISNPLKIMGCLHGAGEQLHPTEAQVAARCHNTRTTKVRKQTNA